MAAPSPAGNPSTGGASATRRPAAGGTPAPAVRGEFLLVTCQGGAEAALHDRQRTVLPEAVRATWRRGMVTFRLGQLDPPDDFFPDLWFARAVIRSLGSVTGGSLPELLANLGTLVPHAAWDDVHVWHRDPRLEKRGDAAAVRSAVLEARGLPRDLGLATRPGDLVLDCLIDTPDRWWVGWHRARTPTSCLPGGLHPGDLPEGKVSRAWLKLDEALAVFAVPLRAGQRAAELGASPGGACQRLLEAGLHVVGIDPAVVDARVAAHPRFEQWRMRARDARVRGFRGVDWLVADMNIDPRSTLAALERIVTAPGVRPVGIIATLKLPHWSRAAELPDWLERFRSCGFEPRARQLSTGGREVCVVALAAARGPAPVRTPARRPRGR